MNIVVDSKYVAADIAIALDVNGREHLVIAAKSTWSIPEPGQRPRPLPPQQLVHSDVYVGQPGTTAMLYGADFARFKPRCDVLFNANAHAPEGAPVTELLVAWQVGSLRKGVRVLGQRTWRSRFGILSPSRPEPFTVQPLHYGFAFGGTREISKEPGETLYEAFPNNPVGMGWAGPRTRSQMQDIPVPNLEAIDDPIRSRQGEHTAVAFSAIGRHWSPRKELAGTYDEAWQHDVFPLLPADYDERHNQCAPECQQMPFPQGGEEVILRNMMRGRSDVRFSLPRLNQQTVRVLRRDYSSEIINAPADTLYFEPDENRFSIVWRASTLIRRRPHEFDTLAIGPVNLAWWNDRALGRNGASCAGCSDQESAYEVLA